MSTPGGIENPCLNPIPNHQLPVERVVWNSSVVSQSQWPEKLLRHAAREINNFVLPEVAVKAAIGGAVGIAIQQGQNFGNLGDRLVTQQISIQALKPHFF